MIIVRVRVTGGGVQSVEVAEDGDGLYAIIAEKLGMEPGSFELLGGFPPKPLEKEGNKTARQLGVRNNDQLILRQDDEAKGAKHQQGAPPKRHRRKEPKLGENKSEMTEKLAEAFTKGGARDAGSVFLRKAAKHGVLSQYAIREGNERFSAGLSGRYKIIIKSNGLAGGDAMGGMLATVEYEKGATGRRSGAKGVDEVKLMNEEGFSVMLKYVLSSSDPEEVREAEERIRPAKMAEYSPRGFWSLVMLAREAAMRTPDEPIEEIILENYLRRLVPDYDWGYIRSRRRTKSAKARMAEENARIIKEREEAEQCRKKRKVKGGNETLDLTNDGGDGNQDQSNGNINNVDIANGPLTGEKDHDLLQDIFQEAAEGDAVMQKLAAEASVTTVTELANMESDKLTDIAKSVSEAIEQDQVEAWHHGARQLLVDQLFHEIVQDAQLVETVKATMSTPCDLMRLRVPGRIDFFANEFSLDKDLLRAWQQKAQTMVEEKPWLRQYRSQG